MDKDAKLIDHLLLDAEDSSEALASLNRIRKSRSDRWSMRAACKRIGISSTGYFSDVLKGKRRLHPKYIEGTGAAFGLSKAQLKYFEVLVLRDQDEKGKADKSWAAELEKVSAPLRMEYVAFPKQLSEGLHWHIIVLSSFSLFKDAPTLRELGEYFGQSLLLPLSKSLHKLSEMGLVEIHNDRYTLSKTRIIFKESEDGLSEIEFLEKSTAHAASQVKAWYPKTEQSIFVSSVVTVKSQDLAKKLPDIRGRIHSILNELNSAQGDQLVEFNLQLFPFDPKIF
jgi:uncharacterized protein (TIGR02147 family)